MSHEPTHASLLDRPDARRNIDEGADAYDVLCLDCGSVRGTWDRADLPAPGLCYKCRCADPRDYWRGDFNI